VYPHGINARRLALSLVLSRRLRSRGGPGNYNLGRIRDNTVERVLVFELFIPSGSILARGVQLFRFPPPVPS